MPPQLGSTLLVFRAESEAEQWKAAVLIHQSLHFTCWPAHQFNKSRKRGVYCERSSWLTPSGEGLVPTLCCSSFSIGLILAASSLGLDMMTTLGVLIVVSTIHRTEEFRGLFRPDPGVSFHQKYSDYTPVIKHCLHILQLSVPVIFVQ